MSMRMSMRMKRAMIVGMLLALAVPVLASQTQPAAKPGWARGTITAWDEGSKSLKIKGDDGQETALVWDKDTKVHGSAKVGEPAKVKHKKDKDGRLLATHIYVGKEEMDKAGD